MLPQNNHFEREFDMRLANQCRRVLLEAGADPTLTMFDDGWGSFLQSILKVGTVVRIMI